MAPVGSGIGAVLPFAVGVGVSPIPIVAGILVLFSQRARTNGPLFLLGWVVALSALVGVVALSLILALSSVYDSVF